MISVCVPVYNTSKCLRKCLDSLKSQAMSDIEFILVDDGSTDDSGEICEEYVAADSRFRVIHQNNGGSASARQTALDNSRGEYIIVCDSDDWVEPDMYEKLYHKAEETNADMVLCGYFSEYSDGKTVVMQSILNETNGLVDNENFILCDLVSSWNKLIRKSLFDNTNTNYEPGINLSEDALIYYKLMRGNPRIAQLDEPLYHYRRLFGEKTYTNSITMSGIKQLRFTYNWLKINYPELKYRSVVEKRAIDLAFAFLRAKDIDIIYAKKFLYNEVTYRALLSHANRFKALIVAFEKLFPLSIAKKILHLFYRRYYK